MAAGGLTELARLAGAAAWLGPEQDLSAYEHGVRGDSGRAAGVLRPASTAEVSALVRHCVGAGIPLLAQGGNTGVVGGSTPDASGRQVILSLERMNRLHEIRPDNRSVHAGAGLRLSALNTQLETEGLFFPIDLAADPSLGGMVATNTGGARFLRYGDVRANTLGLTVVLPDAEGTVLQLGSGLRKDNTAPDWKQLFIGTGGAFGIVTECILNVEPLPRERATALLVPGSDAAILRLLRRLETAFGHQLSAFELMSDSAMQHALAHAPSVRNPFAGEDMPSVALLVEIEQSGTVSAAPAETVLADVLGSFWEEDETLLADARFGPPEEIWSLRHALSEGVRKAGRLFAFDLAFERADVFAFRRRMAERLAVEWPELEVCDFGHVGDGGLHFNLVCHDPARCEGTDYERRLRDFVVGAVVREFGGSFSGEHGIGRSNQRYYDQYTPAVLRTLADQFAGALGVRGSGGLRYGFGDGISASRGCEWSGTDQPTGTVDPVR